MSHQSQMVCVELEAASIASAVGALIVKSNLVDVNAKDTPLRIERVENEQEDGTRIAATIGVGEVRFVHNELEFTLSRTEVGIPVTSARCDRGSSIHERLFLSGPTLEAVEHLCAYAVDVQDHDIEDRYQTLVWRTPGDYWSRVSYAPTRDMDTIIIDEALMTDILTDLDDFVSEETRVWYDKHRIPFRRGYMLYGPPGTGKSSMIAAIASYLKRRVFRLSLTAPKMTDDGLLTAVTSVPSESVVILEDVDALFNQHREHVEAGATLSFSGLLNAIDGVGGVARGVIVIMTTNHIDRIDPALNRQGRIDKSFCLGRVTSDCARRMFLRFYPDEHVSAEKFAKSALSGHGVAPTPAELQSHFIKHRKSDATSANEYVPDTHSVADVSAMWS